MQDPEVGRVSISLQRWEICHLSAVIAAGVVQVDSSKHQDPEGVARISIAIADEIFRQTKEPEPFSEPKSSAAIPLEVG